MWDRRSHPNILPLIGVSNRKFTMVSEWMENGNIREYISTHPEVNRPSVVSQSTLKPFYECSLRQLLGAIDGLIYLHRRNLVHGDLKGVREIQHPHNVVELKKGFVIGKHPH